MSSAHSAPLPKAGGAVVGVFVATEVDIAISFGR